MGAGTYAKTPDEIRKRSRKLDPRAHIGYLVGYDSAKVLIYRILLVWIPHLERMIRTRDVVFGGNKKLNPDDSHMEKRLKNWVTQEEEIEFLNIPVISEPDVSVSEALNQLDDEHVSIADEINQRPKKKGGDNEPLPRPETTPEPKVNKFAAESKANMDVGLNISTHPHMGPSNRSNTTPRAADM
ncbi:hypothetical protein ACJ72_01712 [Emergomyces africanus]|uniref:Retroviral polymerase SH3-like domain-containing protein n=1 Tax=Emergomyces africanus TaxID=1955775 RepID=A0A1B7P4F2_9EURO|nr:hypothetical protein ACJ72_01712 [Emergomyces africanus]